MTRLRDRLDRGSTAISLAIVFPVVLFMVMLVVQASLWWFASQAALSAAREAVAVGRVRGATDDQGVERANWFLHQLDSLAEPVKVDAGESDPTTFRITVKVKVQSIIPGFDGLTLERRASAPKEIFVAPAGVTP